MVQREVSRWTFPLSEWMQGFITGACLIYFCMAIGIIVWWVILDWLYPPVHKQDYYK